MQENLERFKANRAIQEKSTAYYYYYFNDEFMDKYIEDTIVTDWVNHWIYSKGPGSGSRFSPELDTTAYFDMMTDEEEEQFFMEFSKQFHESFTEAEAEELGADGDEAEDDAEDQQDIPNSDLVVGTLVLITNFGTDAEPRKYMWNKSKGEILKKNKDGTFKVRITDVKDSNVLYSKKWYDQEQRALTQKLNLKRDEFQTLKDIENDELKAKEDAEKAKADKAKETAKPKEEPKKETPKDKADKEASDKEKEKAKQESIKRTSRRLM